MLHEYKIKKIADSNGEVRFDIYLSKVEKSWWRKKKWNRLDTYNSDASHNTLGGAQRIVRREMETDKKRLFDRNKKQVNILKEYTYTNIPEYVPEEQEEKFCELKGH